MNATSSLARRTSTHHDFTFTPRDMWSDQSALNATVLQRKAHSFRPIGAGGGGALPWWAQPFFTVGCEHGRLVLVVTAVNKLRVRSASRWERAEQAGESSRKRSFTWAVFILKYELSQLLTTGSLNVGVSVLLCLCQRAVVGRWTRLYGLYWTPDTDTPVITQSCYWPTELLVSPLDSGYLSRWWGLEPGPILGWCCSVCVCVSSRCRSVWTCLARNWSHRRVLWVTPDPPSDTNRVSDRGTGLTQSAYVRGFAQNKQRAKWHTCSL